MEKPNCEKSMPSTPLRQMYNLRQFIRCISSQAEKDMELDHKDHPLALQHWKQQYANTVMKFVLFGPKTEMNSYPTLQDGQHTVE